MTLHIFNPEHDIALASNLSNFTAPHAGRQLRNDLGFLPALWAQEGDQILVQHEESALKAYRRVCHRLVKLGIKKIENGELRMENYDMFKSGNGSGCGNHNSQLSTLIATPHSDRWSENCKLSISPWGWDKAIRRELERMGVEASLLPTVEQIEQIRQLSHRRTSAQLLPLLQMEGTIGEAFECTTVEEVTELMQRYGRLVLKAPWSSSGRGVRFCDAARLVNNEEIIMNNWVRNVIKTQGSIMAEPYYNKVKDFGMEFEADAEGRIHYLGLSLFHTVNGAYEGNILATESVKQEMISRYIPACFLDSVKQTIAERLTLNGYVGPFGIDMMVVKPGEGNHNSQLSILNSQLLLHPCVEINLRRTMGHVALSISPTDDDIRAVMRVIYDGNHYKLKINKLR
jgi:hypothetical protein